MRAQEFVIEYREAKSKRARRAGIDLEAWKDGLEFQINATAHGRDLGRVLFDVQYQGDQPVLVAKDLMILPEYRGQGIAAIMYDYAKELGYTVERSREQTDAGKHFWDKHRGEDARVWEQQRPKLGNDAIRELNGKISMESWFGLLEAFHGYQLTESVDDSTAQAIDTIINNFSVNDPQVGQEYIPNMLIGVNNKIDVYDSQGNHPAKINQLMTLININGPYLTFVDNHGNEKTYPEKKVSETLYVRTVVIKDQQTFDKYRTWMQIKHKQIIPTLSKSTFDENFADGKKPGRKGLAKRMGVNCKQPVSKLRKIAKNSSGERARMAHWCANMKAGKKK